MSSLYLCTDSFDELIYRNGLRVLKSLLHVKFENKNADILFVCTGSSEKVKIESLLEMSFKNDLREDIGLASVETLNDVVTIDKVKYVGSKFEKDASHLINFGTPELYGKWSVTVKCLEEMSDASNLNNDANFISWYNRKYDAVVVMSTINWVLDVDLFLNDLVNFINPRGYLYVLTWHLPPTCLIATNAIIEKMIKNGDRHVTCKLPWNREWMSKKATPILSSWGNDIPPNLAKTLKRFGLSEIQAYHLNKAAYYCYDSEEDVKQFIENLFFNKDFYEFENKLKYPLANTIINDLIKLEDKNAIIKTLLENVVRDNLQTNGHKLNCFQSLTLYESKQNSI